MQNLLIVEDNGQLARLYIKVLHRTGAIIRHASTLKDAFSCLEMLIPDLLLLDLGMPDGSGVSLLAHIRSEPKFEKTNVIVISGKTEKHSEVHHYGVRHVLLKPVSTAMLYDLVTQAIRTPKQG